jgi:transcription antitermination protein NusB
MGSRRKGRETALQILFQMDSSGVSADEAVELYFRHLSNADEGKEFAELLVRRYDTEQSRIDGIIRDVSHHWRLERMTRVDRNILRLGVAELLECTEVPRRVTLNESVELAKRFGSEGSAGFVNGILDRVANDLRKA